jgi:hypothetical protein
MRSSSETCCRAGGAAAAAEAAAAGTRWRWRDQRSAAALGASGPRGAAVALGQAGVSRAAKPRRPAAHGGNFHGRTLGPGLGGRAGLGWGPPPPMLLLRAAPPSAPAPAHRRAPCAALAGRLRGWPRGARRGAEAAALAAGREAAAGAACARLSPLRLSPPAPLLPPLTCWPPPSSFLYQPPLPVLSLRRYHVSPSYSLGVSASPVATFQEQRGHFVAVLCAPSPLPLSPAMRRSAPWL